MNLNELMNMSPNELMNWLKSNFSLTLPDRLITIEDMEVASPLLSEIINKYAYLISLTSELKFMIRDLKRKGKTYKESYENLIDMKEAISNTAEVLKTQYNALSRMITIKIEINKELNMSETR